MTLPIGTLLKINTDTKYNIVCGRIKAIDPHYNYGLPGYSKREKVEEVQLTGPSGEIKNVMYILSCMEDMLPNMLFVVIPNKDKLSTNISIEYHSGWRDGVFSRLNGTVNIDDISLFSVVGREIDILRMTPRAMKYFAVKRSTDLMPCILGHKGDFNMNTCFSSSPEILFYSGYEPQLFFSLFSTTHQCTACGENLIFNKNVSGKPDVEKRTMALLCPNCSKKIQFTWNDNYLVLDTEEGIDE